MINSPIYKKSVCRCSSDQERTGHDSYAKEHPPNGCAFYHTLIPQHFDLTLFISS